MSNPIEPEILVPNNSIVSITQHLDKSRSSILASVESAEDVVIVIRDKVKNESLQLVAASKTILNEANQFPVTTDNALLQANQFLVDLAPVIKRAGQYKDAVTKVSKGTLKEIDGIFKNIIDPLEAASDTLRRKVIQYRREQEEAAKQVAAILSDADIEQEPLTVTPALPFESKTIRVDNGQVSFSKKWTFTITDIDKVPEEIVRAAVKTSRGRDALESVIRSRVEGGVRKIEGVLIEETEQTTVRK